MQQNEWGCSFARVLDCLPEVERTSLITKSSAVHTRLVLSGKRSSPSDHKIAVAKLCLNSGRKHVNYSGETRKARQLKKPCHENCNRCEKPRLNQAERQDIYKNFWTLSDHERQWLFIYGSVKTAAPSNKSSVGGGKQTTQSYFFSLAETQRRVCKTMFKNTLCFCDSWIDSALSHFSKDGYKPDMRGKIRSAEKTQNVGGRTICV